MSDNTRGPFESSSIPESYRRFLQPVIFDPWAARLVDFVGIREGQTVLDVAAGTGAVSRAAARAVGPRGRVIAADISTAMLAYVAFDATPEDAPIELLESSATEIILPASAVDIALCQQGFPFIPDRVEAAREMHRVLRPGGTIGVAVWAAGVRLEPFDSYGEALIRAGFDTPLIRGSASGKMSMSETEVSRVLSAGGFTDVEVALHEMVLDWPSIDVAVAGIRGTPYWPVIEVLNPAQQSDVIHALHDAFTGTEGEPLRQNTTAVLARATVRG